MMFADGLTMDWWVTAQKSASSLETIIPKMYLWLKMQIFLKSTSHQSTISEAMIHHQQTTIVPNNRAVNMQVIISS